MEFMYINCVFYTFQSLSTFRYVLIIHFCYKVHVHEIWHFIKVIRLLWSGLFRSSKYLMMYNLIHDMVLLARHHNFCIVLSQTMVFYFILAGWERWRLAKVKGISLMGEPFCNKGTTIFDSDWLKINYIYFCI